MAWAAAQKGVKAQMCQRASLRLLVSLSLIRNRLCPHGHPVQVSKSTTVAHSSVARPSHPHVA